MTFNEFVTRNIEFVEFKDKAQELEQKIKEFELILKQEKEAKENSGIVSNKINTLLNVFQEHFNLKE